jgi:hypothetical protein
MTAMSDVVNAGAITALAAVAAAVIAAVTQLTISRARLARLERIVNVSQSPGLSSAERDLLTRARRRLIVRASINEPWYVVLGLTAGPAFIVFGLAEAFFPHWMEEILFQTQPSPATTTGLPGLLQVVVQVLGATLFLSIGVLWSVGIPWRRRVRRMRLLRSAVLRGRDMKPLDPRDTTSTGSVG